MCYYTLRGAKNKGADAQTGLRLWFLHATISGFLVTGPIGASTPEFGIHRLFAYCKGNNSNIHIWALFGYFICLVGEIRFYL